MPTIFTALLLGLTGEPGQFLLITSGARKASGEQAHLNKTRLELYLLLDVREPSVNKIIHYLDTCEYKTSTTTTMI